MASVSILPIKTSVAAQWCPDTVRVMTQFRYDRCCSSLQHCQNRRPTREQCCASGASPPPPSGGSGQAIVDAAVKEEGLPYVWGGGGCSGPSGGGFDCSGLTQYAACQAIDVTIPRTAQTQYHSSLGKHIPRAEAKAGDMIFWASGGDCAGSVAHVGIFMSEGKMVNAAHTGTPVREQPIWTSSGGESICPDAVRFW